VIIEPFSVEQNKLFIINPLISLFHRLCSFFSCTLRVFYKVMKSDLSPGTCLALYENLIFHLAELEKLLGKVSEKGKFQPLAGTFLKDFFRPFLSFLIPFILRCIVFQK